jgi:DNA-binding CsgD family transcriptional regulator
LQAISVPLAAALRRAALRPGPEAGAGLNVDGPGVMILGPNNEVLMTNGVARHWMHELAPQSASSSPHDGPLTPVPLAVHQVAERVRAQVGSSADAPGRLAEPYCRVRTGSGRWLTLRASAVDGDLPVGQGITVVIDATSSLHVAQILMLAHGLTRRERQVMHCVIAGTASAGIASQLNISVNTVQDHLKAIFAKVGVRSRGQLVAQLLDQQPLPDSD